MIRLEGDNQPQVSQHHLNRCTRVQPTPAATNAQRLANARPSKATAEKTFKMLAFLFVIHSTAALSLFALAQQLLGANGTSAYNLQANSNTNNQNAPDDTGRLIASSINSIHRTLVEEPSSLIGPAGGAPASTTNASLYHNQAPGQSSSDSATPSFLNGHTGEPVGGQSSGDIPSGGVSDESQEATDLNFTLMNAPHDKIQAVKQLINTQRSTLNVANTQTLSSQHDQSTGNSLQCTHKGRQYLNGQSVPIEEQPCLNCTCRRAILQCYLRVCPPIISLEAHKKMQAMATRGSDAAPQKCRMVKDARQCCPTLRCEQELEAYDLSQSQQQQATNGLNNSASTGYAPPPTSSAESNQQHQDSAAQNQQITSQQQQQQQQADLSTVVASNGNSLSTAESENQPTRVMTVKDESEHGGGLVVRIEQPPASNRSVNEVSSAILVTTTPAYTANELRDSSSQSNNHLPKLTVIKGPSGQRDSILLITSNPSAVSSGLMHARDKLGSALGNASAGQQAMLSQALSSDQRFNTNYQNNVLLDSLLETVYSSVAQLNGLNIQGSCMINGSLYVEGSAVIPEGTAYCQYCYCIRQKVMCIKPKCHLMISGCTPKYSNEYACCPTSYTCSSPGDMSSVVAGSPRLEQSMGVARLSAGEQHSAAPGSLSSKLSAALESLSSRLPSQDRPATSGSDVAGSARQVDRSLNSADGSSLLPATLLALINSLAGNSNNNYEPPMSSSNTLGRSAAPPTTAALGASRSSGTSQTLANTTAASTQAPSSESSAQTNQASSTTAGSTTSTSTFITTTTTTTTSAPALTTRAATTLKATTAEKEEASKRDSDGDEEEEEEEETEAGDSGAGAGGGKIKEFESKKLNNSSATNATAASATGGEQAASVSDFLEPMNKLGPLVMSPTAPSGCVENGRQYAIGEQIPTLESCKHCYCGLDGVKECKMIECGLKIAHNCKPVTPEGHCCPVRYDCPSSRSQASSTVMASSRYRSETGQVKPSQPSKATTPFQSISQCKSDSGEDCTTTTGGPNHIEASTAASPATGDNLGGDISLDAIPGLSVDNDPLPVVRTTRIVDENGPPTTSTIASSAWPLSSPGGGDSNGFNNSSGNNATAGLSLTEELNKFIMQINHNATQGTGYSLVSPNVVSPHQQHRNGTTQEMMINDQHSRMVDYHSVQPPTQTGGAAVGAHRLTGGIPSIEPVYNHEPAPRSRQQRPPVDSGEPLGGARVSTASSVEYAAPGGVTTGSEPSGAMRDAMGTVVTGGQRDSRSTNAQKLTDAHLTAGLNNGSQPRGDQAEPCPPDQPADSMSISDDYLDDNSTSNGTISRPGGATGRGAISEVLHVRLMRNNHQPSDHMASIGHSSLPHLTNPLVTFDDSLPSGGGGAASGRETGPTDQGSIVNATNLTDEPNLNNYTSLGRTEAPFNGSFDNLISTVVASSPADDSTTPSPQDQPTTGTPIGLEADRGRETRGWLKSLSGIVQSFGRRLSGGHASVPGLHPSATTLLSNPIPANHRPNELDGAASGGPVSPVSPTAEGTAAHLAAGPRDTVMATETARSKEQPSLFNQLLEMISSSEHLRPSSNESPQGQRLVMRPLAGVLQVAQEATAANNQPHQARGPRASGQMGAANNSDQTMMMMGHLRSSGGGNQLMNRPISPYEPGVSPSEVEIVTAAVPIDQDIFTPDGATLSTSSTNKMSEQIDRNAAPPANMFARRDGLIAMSEADSTSQGQDNQHQARSNGHWPQSQASEPSSSTQANKIGYFTVSSSVDTEAGSSTGTLHRIDKQLISDRRPSQHRGSQFKLTCYDAILNKTYQANERMPKDDPCKTCTCVLGAELCQPLVCPERPAENCSEERRPGECCPNYICTNSITRLNNSNDMPAMRAVIESISSSRAQPQASTELPSGGRHSNGHMAATQRALNVNSEVARALINGLDRNVGPQRAAQAVSGAPSSASQSPLNVIPFQMHSSVRQNNQPQQSAQQPSTQTDRQQRPGQVPLQQPFRIGDYPNLLPPHLRFRPNSQAGPFNSAFLSSFAPGKVLFSSPSSSGQRNLMPMALGGQTVRRNDFANTNNMRLPQMSPPGGDTGATLASNLLNNHRANSPMSPSILAHSPRQQAGGSMLSAVPMPMNGVGASSNQRRQFADQEIRQPLAVSSNQNNLNIWKSHLPDVASSIQGAGILPSNVLISRMSGAQIPLVQAAAAAASPSLVSESSGQASASTESNWQPSNWPSHQVAGGQNSAAGAGPLHVVGSSSPVQGSNSSQKVALAMIPLPTSSGPVAPSGQQQVAGGSGLSVDSNEVPLSDGAKSDSSRFLFQVSNDNAKIDSANDSGFRPIRPQVQRVHTSTSQSVTSGNTMTTLATTSMTPETDPKLTLNLVTHSDISNDSLQSTTAESKSQPPQPQTTTTTTTMIADPTSSDQSTTTAATTTSTFDSSRSSEAAISFKAPEDKAQTLANEDETKQIFTEQPMTTKSSIAQSSSSEQATSQQPTISSLRELSSSDDKEPATGEVGSSISSSSTQSSSEPVSSSSGGSETGEPSFDPMSLFRVSECNIYGRLYKVGSVVEELSDACKRCMCTSSGVECQNKCR